MYQTEDLVRVYSFDIDLIEKYVIHHFPIDIEEKKLNKAWYKNMLEKMKAEGIEEKGHLSKIQNVVDELTNLHQSLIKEDDEYQNIYQKAKSNIDQNVELSEGKVDNEVQICLNGIYGLLLLRMNGREVDESLMEPLNTFGDLLSYLSFKYNQRKGK